MKARVITNIVLAALLLSLSACSSQKTSTDSSNFVSTGSANESDAEKPGSTVQEPQEETEQEQQGELAQEQLVEIEQQENRRTEEENKIKETTPEINGENIEKTKKVEAVSEEPQIIYILGDEYEALPVQEGYEYLPTENYEEFVSEARTLTQTDYDNAEFFDPYNMPNDESSGQILRYSTETETDIDAFLYMNIDKGIEGTIVRYHDDVYYLPRRLFANGISHMWAGDFDGDGQVEFAAADSWWSGTMLHVEKLYIYKPIENGKTQEFYFNPLDLDEQLAKYIHVDFARQAVIITDSEMQEIYQEIPFEDYVKAYFGEDDKITERRLKSLVWSISNFFVPGDNGSIQLKVYVGLITEDMTYPSYVFSEDGIGSTVIFNVMLNNSVFEIEPAAK